MNKVLWMTLGFIGIFSVPLSGCLDNLPIAQDPSRLQPPILETSSTPTDADDFVAPAANPPVNMISQSVTENAYHGSLITVQDGLSLRVNGSDSRDSIRLNKTYFTRFVEAGTDSKLVVVYVTLRNTGNKPKRLAALDMRLRDNQGSLFERVQTIHEEFMIGLWAEERGLFNPRHPIPPDTSVETIKVFRVMSDAQRWEMLVDNRVFAINPNPIP